MMTEKPRITLDMLSPESRLQLCQEVVELMGDSASSAPVLLADGRIGFLEKPRPDVEIIPIASRR